MCLDRHSFEKLKYVYHEANIHPNKAQVDTTANLYATTAVVAGAIAGSTVTVAVIAAVVVCDRNGENLCLYVRQY